MRFPRALTPLLPLCALLAACTSQVGEGPGDGIGHTATDSTELALVSSTGEVGVLRRGETLAIQSEALAGLDPDTIYRAEVVAGERTLSESDVITDGEGGVLLAAVMHDVGEDGSVHPGDALQVRLRDGFGDIAAATEIGLDAPPTLQRPGWNVDEVQPPHVYATDASGEPQNAFAVGGSGSDEVRGPVHIAGEGFPEAAAGGMVDVYVVEDGDEWRGRSIPTSGDASHVAGPVEVAVAADGTLAPTPIFEPGLGDVGTFDFLVDVDRDGRFEWRFDAKDGADGLAKVGFTVQYSESWLAERTSQHILVNIAYDSHSRDGGQWRNTYSADEPVFMYLNPPVMNEYHFSVTKTIVRHRDFETFWNDPAMIDASCGGVPYEEAQHNNAADRANPLATDVQGCGDFESTPDADFWTFDMPEDAEDGGDGGGDEMMATFDVVFDRDGDGCYDVGEDLLDITSTDTGGDLIPIDTFLSLPAAQRVGFTLTR